MSQLDPITGGVPAPTSDAPYATGGSVQPRSAHGPKIKKIKVKAHTRTVKTKAPAKTPAKKAPALDAQTKALINAAVSLKFGGQEQGYKQQLQGAQRFASGVPAWYTQAVQNIKGQQTPVAPVTAPAPTGDPAADSRANLNSAFSQQLTQRQGAQNDFLTNVGAGLQVQQGQVLNQNAGQQNQIRQNRALLKGQEGDFRTTTLADFQAAQQKADVDQAKINASLAIASGKLDLAKQILTNVTVPNTSSQITTRQKNAGTTAANQRETARQHKIKNAIDVGKLAEKSFKDSLTAKPKVKPIAPTVKNKAKTDWDGAQAMIRSVYGKKHFRADDVADQLSTSKHSIDRDIALAAAQMVKNARMGIRGIDDPRLAKRLAKRFGLKVPVVKQSPVIGNILGGALGALTAGEPTT